VRSKNISTFLCGTKRVGLADQSNIIEAEQIQTANVRQLLAKRQNPAVK